MSESKTISNNFLKGFDKIVSKDQLRPAMGVVYFHNGNAVATDAHKLVIVDLKMFGISEEDKQLLEGFMADADVLAELKTLKTANYITLERGLVNIYKTGRAKKLKSLELLTPAEVGNYPNYEAVLPRPELSGPINNFSIDGQFLLDIQNCYKCCLDDKQKEKNKDYLTDLRLETYSESNRPIMVTSSTGLFKALLMPRVAYK